MRTFMLVVALLLPSFAWALCPPGQYEAFDTFGNKICKSFDNGATTSIQRPGRGQPDSAGGCPAGTQPWVDEFGNKTCRSIESGQQFYDTSKGCPIGMLPGFDIYGKPVCKR